MDPIIFIREARLAMDGMSPRRFKAWCRRMGLVLYTVAGTNKQYLLREEFEAARLRDCWPGLQRCTGQRPVRVLRSACTFAADRSFALPDGVENDLDRIGPFYILPQMDDKPLHIPKNQRFKGVRVYCNECNTLIYDTCKLTGKPVAKCKFGDRHRYKIIKYQKGSNARETLTLQTRDYAEVIRIATEFFRQTEPSPIAFSPQLSASAPVASLSLRDATEQYYAYLENVGVPAHRRRSRSKDHVTDIRHSIRLFTDCLESNRLDPNRLPVAAISDDVVGLFHTYLTDTKGYSNRTYNKVFSHLTTFVSWYGKHRAPVENWFEKTRRKHVHREAVAITPSEALRLFESVTPEGGIERVATGKKHVRNYYYPWAIAGWKLMALTGRRREEIVSMRFNDIQSNEDGYEYIKVEDIKVNRIQGRSAGEAQKYTLVPLIKELKTLLSDELDWERWRGSDAYILAPEETIDRKLMAELLTRSFSHYHALLNTGKTLTLKSLRKLYISSVAKLLRGSPKGISGHSSDQVLEHYIDPTVFVSVADGLTILTDPNARETELNRARNQRNDSPNQTLEP